MVIFKSRQKKFECDFKIKNRIEYIYSFCDVENQVCNRNTSMISNYFIKSITACGKTTCKENLKLSQDHLNRDALKP